MKKTIEETHEGVTVQMETKRGSGTRDSDKVKLTAHFDDVEHAKEETGSMKEALEMYADAARSVQPTLKRDEE